MTLLLGPPGSGKTTLLSALAGKLDPALKVSGSVTYNGHTMDEFVAQRTSAYVSQNDVHIGELTVRETLTFAARCHGMAAMGGHDDIIVVDYILKILGLEGCSDTEIGDQVRRGISGGQKKRVTIGI
ncbi:hypothetical protein M569_09209 [Genlisea aurea]|uniref:ABC transporter domain-containing protein n=1 Tax=Genlisea aurea TaxID=192259 RepID=S8DR47_9LAMI|nr:hypothetical protein M569_09209 [Genlisea aurea]